MIQMLHWPVELWLVTLHLIGDFPLQPNWMAQRKTSNPLINAAHSLIHGALFAPLAWYIYPRASGAIIFTMWIVITHFIIDSRSWVSPNEEWDNPEMWVWINDQILHFIALSLAFAVVGALNPRPF